MEPLTTLMLVFAAAFASLALALVALVGVAGSCSASCESAGARCDLCSSGRAAKDEIEVRG